MPIDWNPHGTPDNMTPDPREDKLPKWAKDQMGVLRKKVLETRAIAETISNEIVGPDALVTDGFGSIGNGIKRIQLPLDGWSFRLTLGPAWDNYIEARYEPHYKAMHVSAGRCMHILPQSGNAVLCVPTTHR